MRVSLDPALPERPARSTQRQSYLERLALMVEPVSGAAALLGVSRQRVLQLIQGGALDAVKIGKDWFVSSLSLQERLTASPRRSEKGVTRKES